MARMWHRYIFAKQNKSIDFKFANTDENLIEQAETVEDVKSVEVNYTVGYVESGAVEKSTDDT